MTHDELVEKVARALYEAEGGVDWDNLDEGNKQDFRNVAPVAIAIVLEEAAKRVREVRNDPLTQLGDRYGKAGDWMRAALDDAENAIAAMMSEKC